MGLITVLKVRWWMCVLVLLNGSHGILGQATAPQINCLPPGAQNQGTPPDLPNIPESFRVKIELTVEGRNWTEQADLIFDSGGNRAVINWMNGGVQTTVLYSYSTNEVFHITDTNCTVGNMSRDFYTNLLGSPSYEDGVISSPSGPSALYFGSDIQKIYLGKKQVRGVMCDHWQACVGWAAPVENFTIDYYFSEAGWGTPSTYPQVPMRYEMNGTQVMPNGQKRTFHRVYDFFDFMEDADSEPTVFETPPGIVCPGRQVMRPLPDMTSRAYHFREEIVDMAFEQITQADVWYDLDQKLVRVDYRPPSNDNNKDNPPVSEVHDFNYGIRYVKDLLTGQCTPQALQQNSFDAKLNTVAYLKNGSYVLHMKNPLSFFFLDSNFSYSGQRYARDALCDVYISQRADYDFYDNGTLYEAKVETYFLAEGIADVPNDALQAYASSFPFRCELWLPKFSLNLVYNIFDFDTGRPEMNLFDVSDCYDDSHKLDFKVQFPAQYKRDTEHMVLLKGQNTLAETMEVSPLRVTNLRLEHDVNYVYIAATLLGPTPDLGQFTHIPKSVLEMRNDLTFADVPNAAACSSLCVSNLAFTCLSFQYCPGDHNACGLSKQHVGDRGVSVIAGQCDLYSRTVDTKAPIPEMSIDDAYANLLESIAAESLTFDIPQDDGSSLVYMAMASEITFGRQKYVDIPTLAGQFSYRMEIVFPRDNFVQTYDVWYDSTSKLVRYDTRDVLAGPPYYTPYTISSIHDFNTGVAYNIDTRRGNCTATSIPTTGGFDTLTQNATRVASGVNMALMKSPLELFYLDNSTYVFAGQKTVRGILCDVYESVRTDYTIDTGTGGPQHSIFQFYFQSSSWAYVADSHKDTTSRQPVKLLVLDAEANQFVVYNFYNFNDEHIDYMQFDISACFDDDRRLDFVMDFNMSYHPYLDDNEWQFKAEVQMLMSSEIRVSPLRIQNIEVTYSMDQTYVIATLLGEVDPQLHFAQDGTVTPYTASVSSPISDIPGCAAFCYYNNQIICNSFDICSDGTCYLSTKHVPDGAPNPAAATANGVNVTCDHFSRVVNGSLAEPSLTTAFTSLKDVVYKGLFVLILPIDGGQQITFVATGIRSDILRQTAPGETGGADLQRFSVYKTRAQMSGNGLTLAQMAVDDCAASCLAEDLFSCQAFQYCFTTGDCFLNANYPSQGNVNMTDSGFCDIYARLYSDAYTRYPGQAMETAADDSVKASSLELCAMQCTVSTAFDCLSFDYCPTTGDCQLRRVHMLDAKPSFVVNSSMCTHYSRNYLSDFSVKPHKVIPGQDMVIVDETDPISCAKMCREQGGCLSFDFCDAQCHLSRSSGKMDPSVADSSTCDLYILKDSASQVNTSSTLPRVPLTTTTTAATRPPVRTTQGQNPARTTRVVQPPSVAPTNAPITARVTPSPGHVTARPTSGPNTSGCPANQQQTGGSSDDTGPRAGIAVGVLVLGLLLGAGLVLVVQRIRGKRSDEDNLELMPSPSYR